MYDPQHNGSSYPWYGFQGSDSHALNYSHVCNWALDNNKITSNVMCVDKEGANPLFCWLCKQPLPLPLIKAVKMGEGQFLWQFLCRQWFIPNARKQRHARTVSVSSSNQHVVPENMVGGSSMIGFLLVIAVSEWDMSGFEPGPLGWNTRALTNEQSQEWTFV